MKAKKIHKTNACRILDKAKIPYEIYEFPWSEDHVDAKTVAKELGIPNESIYKTIVTIGDKTGVTIACLPGTEELNLKALAKASGNKKIEMLPMKELEETTGYIRGGCSPIGMKKNYPTFLASEAQERNEIIISAGKRGMQLALNPADLAKVVHLKIMDITENKV
ncbi:Cys-tRNA(Pro) deacylase [Carnobacterium sp.]